MRIYIYLVVAVAALAAAWYVDDLRNTIEELDSYNKVLIADNTQLERNLERAKKSESVNLQIANDLSQQMANNQQNFERVNNEITKYRNELNTCKLNSKFVQLHNTAAKVPIIPESTTANNGGKLAGDALDVINYNYGICYQWRARGEACSKWILEQEKIYNAE